MEIVIILKKKRNDELNSVNLEKSALHRQEYQNLLKFF